MGHPVLLHGFTGSSSSWGQLVDGLSGAGQPPVLVDLPGHGRNAGVSDSAHFTIDAMLDVIAGAGDWPEALVGYSMGGRLALHFALAYPRRVTKLVLESASPGLTDEAERATRRDRDEALASSIERDGIEAFVDEWERMPLFETQGRLSEETLHAQRLRRLRNDPASLAAALRGLGTAALPGLWDRLGELDMPVLLVVGALDEKFVEIGYRMEERLPHADLVVVPDSGHAVHLERPAAWLGAVTDFLGRG